MKKAALFLLAALVIGGCHHRQPAADADTDAATASQTKAKPEKQTKEQAQAEKQNQRKQKPQADADGLVRPNKDDPRECARNFTYDGSFFKGRTFKTHVFVPSVTKANAIQRAARYLTMQGWQIRTSDEKLGIISAFSTVSYGQGKTSPYNVGFDPVKGGVKIDITFQLSGGTTAAVESVLAEFCKTVQAVEGK